MDASVFSLMSRKTRAVYSRTLRDRAVCLLTFLLKVWPWSPSPQPSGFSFTLDLDDFDGDQGITSLDLQPNQPFSIQIFGTDFQGPISIFVRFEFSNLVAFAATSGNSEVAASSRQRDHRLDGAGGR